MLKVEPIGQRGRNANEDVAGADSEAFARWLHRRYSLPVYSCHRQEDIILPSDTLLQYRMFSNDNAQLTSSALCFL